LGDDNTLWAIGIDIGGTFTDIVGVNQITGELRLGKVPSRFEDPVSAINEAIGSLELDPEEIETVVHGTTRVTNAIVQEKLPEIALIATAGFEDTIEIGRLSRAHLYRLDLPPKVPPLVPATGRFGIEERLGVDLV
jgi:N-methylhydantoinase A